MDTYQLEQIVDAHPIDASVFIPFVILRLDVGADDHAATLQVQLRDLPDRPTESHALRITWSEDSDPPESPAIQDRVITEWAACGFACVLVSKYTTFRIRNVAAYGDRFDYWISDGQQDLGLEISGTLSGELDLRHTTKVNQLRANPYQVDGFVMVVGFAAAEAILSFHRFKEASA